MLGAILKNPVTRGLLIKIAIEVVMYVIKQLLLLVRNLNEQVIRPMQVMVQQVTGGIWRGDGANAFVEAVNNMMVPDTERMSSQIDTLSKNINFATTTMQQADAKAGTVFRNLGDVFAKVF